MKQTTINLECKKKLDEANELYKSFNYSFYWLEAQVKQGLLTKSEAGFLYLEKNKKGRIK